MSEVTTEKQQFWLNHLEAADRSGKSIAEYAREHNLTAQRLYRWRHALKNNTATISTKAKFMRVVTTNSTQSSRLTVGLCGTILEFSSLPDPLWLSSLLSTIVSKQ